MRKFGEDLEQVWRKYGVDMEMEGEVSSTSSHVAL
jgi:hypothetical protein